MLLSELLKERTNASHYRLELQMHVNEIFTKRLSYAVYCDLIQVNHAVISAIEAEVFSALPEDIQAHLQVQKRIKLPALQKDLSALGLFTSVMVHPQKPVYNNTAEALGGMYVMEGATLGGNVIARRLKETPGLTDQPFYFYTVYGEQTRVRWLDFKEVLDTRVKPEDFETCIAKANETFDFYHRVAVKIMAETEI